MIDSVALRTVQIEQWQHDDDYVRLRYPRIVGDAAARLNPIIERWIGGHCPIIGPKPEKFDNIPACVAAFTAACVKQHAHTPAGQHFACTMDSTADIRLDAAGLLGVVLKSYVYTGGAHGQTLIADLNLDLNSGRALKLDDLLNVVDKTVLSDKIEWALRRQRHITADQSLKQAGFFKDNLPVPTTVLVLPEGLLFTYQSYDVAPYVMGQPQALVPYNQLSGMLRRNGLLPHVQALQATSA